MENGALMVFFGLGVSRLFEKHFAGYGGSGAFVNSIYCWRKDRALTTACS